MKLSFLSPILTFMAATATLASPIPQALSFEYCQEIKGFDFFFVAAYTLPNYNSSGTSVTARISGV